MRHNLLIADSDHQQLNAMADALGPLGHRIQQTSPGELLEARESTRPDLVVLGVDSGGDAYSALLGALKQQEGTFTPILLSLPVGMDVAEGWLQQADDIVTKPVDGPMLQSRVRSLLTIKASVDKLRTEVVRLRNTRDRLKAELAREREKLDMALCGVHDLNNPVSVVQFNLLFAQKSLRTQPRECEEALREAAEAARRLQQLTQHALIVVEGEEKGFVMEMVRFKLSTLLENVLSGYQEEARIRNVELRLETPPDLYAEADPAALTRVLENLTRNALRYSGNDGQVLVEAVREDAWIRLSVYNTGRSVRPEHRDSVFGRFQRPGSREMGTGLGLYLCKRVVDAHRGQISIESTDGWATHVAVRLPRRMQRAANPN